MEEIKGFVSKIKEFSNLNAAQQIKYFVYYLQIEKSLSNITAKNVRECFDELHINPYSNIAAYLKKRSEKSNLQEFLSSKNGYILLAKTRHEIEKELNVPVEAPPTDSLYPQSIFAKAPTYLIAFSKEASNCYDYGLYNSCLFMLRKITEILLIELFESKRIEDKIKTPKGDYFQLAELIKASVSESSWKFSKIVKENLPNIKLLADSSVHSKRFSAKRADIDPMKTNIRITFEEILTIINYPIIR
ncbi:MAG: hypothetical protein BGO31_03380 [Bacteroidetes bacterium 43-16]|nr:MAG: hypothetical protein BGO31_03380 [Bacteroidetes bacterium 43-16]